MHRQPLSQRFRLLLKGAGTSQDRIARRVEEQSGLPFSQPRLSDALRGRRSLTGPEKETLLAVLVEQHVLGDRQEALWVAAAFGIARAQVERLFPPPAVVCTLATPPQLACCPLPPAHEQIVDRLLLNPSAGAPLTLRIVTLSGSPGAGKTTLAQRLAFDARVRERYRAILYASLDGTNGNEVIAGWLAHFGASFTGEIPSAAALQRELGGRRALYILDDVPDAGALRSAVTLREQDAALVVGPAAVADHLGVAGEDRVMLPGWDGAMALAFVAASCPVRIDQGRQEIVAALNAQVGGMPLAWQVLAPWLRVETNWSAVLDGVRDAPQVLLDGSVSLSGCLRAAYGRLSKEAGRALRALGVFALAGWDVDALSAVLDVPRIRALAAAAALQDTGWVHPSPLAAGRLEMHRLQHAFAASLTAQDPERAAYQQRHAHVYAERTGAVGEGQDEADWPVRVVQLRPDLPQVYRAQGWTAGAGHRLAVRLFLNLAPYLIAFHDLARWQAWGEMAREIVEREPGAFEAADRYSLYAQLGWMPRPFEEALAYTRRARAIAAAEMAAWNEVYALGNLAWLYGDAGWLAEAEGALLEAWQAAWAGGEHAPSLAAWVLNEAAGYYARTGNLTGCRALADLLEPAAAADVGQGLHAACGLGSRGEVYARAGRRAEAVEAFRAAVAFHEQAGNRTKAAEMAVQMARSLAYLCREDEARATLAGVKANLADLPPDVRALYGLAAGEVSGLIGDVQAAILQFEAALSACQDETTHDWALELDIRLALGEAYRSTGQRWQAAAALEGARRLAELRFQPFWVWQVDRCLSISERSEPPQVTTLLNHLASQV